MQFYEFGDALRPLGEKAPEKWENVLALLEPSELSAVTLPDTLTPPLTSDSVYGSQLCALLTDQNGITGHIRIPAQSGRPPLRVFVVAGKCAHRRSRPCGRELSRRHPRHASA